MKRNLKKAISLIMSAAIIFAMLPVISLPAQAGMTSFNISGGNITIETDADNGNCKLTQDGHTSYNLANIPITGTTTAYSITVLAGTTANITITNLSIDLSATPDACALDIQNGASVNLTVSGTNTLKSGASKAGIQVPGAYTDGAAYSAATLTVTGTGTLNVYGGVKAAGIGGSLAANSSVGSITINNGTINAFGGNSSGDGTAGGAGAGIGGAYGSGGIGSGGTLIINDGTVTAVGGNGATNQRGAPGIGSDQNVDISITGGGVTATGGVGVSGSAFATGGAGIGGHSNVNISITGGTVDAAGANSPSSVAGIGACSGSTGDVAPKQISLTMNSAASVKAYSYSENDSATNATPAILVSSGALEAGSTASVLMATFSQIHGSGKTVEVRDISGTTVVSTTTRVTDCRSVAMTLPSAATYALYASDTVSGFGYWKHSPSTANSPAYPVTGAGLFAFYEVSYYGNTLPVFGLSASSGNASFTQGGASVQVDGSLTLSSFDSGIEKATVTIRNFKTNDVLEYPAQIGNITGSYNNTNGILTLSGSDSQSNYQAALRSVKFSTTSSDATARVIDFAIGSGLYCAATGHFYEYVSVPGNITWTAAKAAAELKTLYGRAGYLITIVSAAESDYILTKVTGTGWIGARDIDDNTAVGDWRWVTGPEALADGGNGLAFWSGFSGGASVDSMFSNWNSGEPNNSESNERAGQMLTDGSLGRWNDLSEASAIAGYFVEYGGVASDTPLTLSGSKTVDIAAPATANAANNSVSSSSASVTAGSTVTLTASGDRQSQAGTIIGDERYVPLSWSSTESGKSGNFMLGVGYTSSYATAAAGNYTVTATFLKQSWNGTSWVNGTNDTKTISITVTEALPDVEETTPSKTLTVTETSSELFAESPGAIIAEANVNNAFSSSVEVKVTDTEQETASFGFGAGTDVYPFDISLYVKGTDTKTQPASGYAVTISLPIPQGLLDVKDQLLIVHKSHDGIVTNLNSSLVQKNGIWYMVFEASEFSPYALVVSNLLTYNPASGLPYYLSNGIKTYIGFAANGKYLAPEGVTVLFAPNPKDFSDTSAHWGKPYVDFVTEREVFVGTSANTFSPDSGMTRAMFATVIGRLFERSYGIISLSEARAFTDCSYDDYYGKYVDWAAKNGIIQGVGGGLFQPDRQVSRQEIAAMLYRFASFLKLPTSPSANSALSYSDSSSIASWAQDAALYCQENAIISGRGGGSFAPSETATRVEVAAIIERFIKLAIN